MNASISTSPMLKYLTITNNGKNINYKSINTIYHRLLNEGYTKDQIFIKVLNPQRYFTLKSKDGDFEETLDDYYRNKVPDPSKFTNHFEVVQFGLFKDT